MATGIFISYSRKDSKPASALAKKLRAKGMRVWMDQVSLSPSDQWAGEVVEAIQDCSAFLVLLSSTSVESHNVLKELSLASEKRKRVVPIDLDTNDLPASFQYALAGIQKVGIGDFQAICTAIEKGPARLRKRDQKKSLMILPFEDLSPNQNNTWFSEGLMSELISTLSNVKSLRLIQEKTSRDFRNVKVKMLDVAREYEVRYFIEGSVRKFDDQIKINVQLLDSQEGEYIWTYTHKGVFADIFTIQEEVALKVVEGLKIKLTSEEERKIEDKGTENAEAYELIMKAKEYFDRNTKESYLHSLSLVTHALKVDPHYAHAMQFKSNVLLNLHRSYDRKKKHLQDAEQLAKKALALKPDLWSVYSSLSSIYRLQGNYQQAEAAILKYVRQAPEDFQSHFSLGFYYDVTNQPSKAITCYESSLRLQEDDLSSYFNLVLNCSRAGDEKKRLFWAREALPYYEKHLKLRPDNEPRKVDYANLLFLANKHKASREYLASIGNPIDSRSLYNIACLQVKLNDNSEALKSLNLSVTAGFSNVEDFRADPDLDPLRETPEFQNLLKRLSEH